MVHKEAVGFTSPHRSGLWGSPGTPSGFSDEHAEEEGEGDGWGVGGWAEPSINTKKEKGKGKAGEGEDRVHKEYPKNKQRRRGEWQNGTTNPHKGGW